MHYPEISAGGYSRVDGSVAFYGRVQALLCEIGSPATIVEFGAGRGRMANDPVEFRRRLQELRGPDRTVIGVDIDPVVLSNPRLDKALLIDGGGRIPLEDESADMIVSEWTFEHVEQPALAAAELDRVLRPGGWICALTPNRWGYIAVGATLVPNRFHVQALRRLQPEKAKADTFPTTYGMNTRRALDRLFPTPRFAVHTYAADAEPQLYAGGSTLLTGALGIAHRLPGPLKSVLNIFIRKAE